MFFHLQSELSMLFHLQSELSMLFHLQSELSIKLPNCIKLCSIYNRNPNSLTFYVTCFWRSMFLVPWLKKSIKWILIKKQDFKTSDTTIYPSSNYLQIFTTSGVNFSTFLLGVFLKIIYIVVFGGNCCSEFFPGSFSQKSHKLLIGTIILSLNRRVGAHTGSTFPTIMLCIWSMHGFGGKSHACLCRRWANVSRKA